MYVYSVIRAGMLLRLYYSLWLYWGCSADPSWSWGQGMSLSGRLASPCLALPHLSTLEKSNWSFTPPSDNVLDTTSKFHLYSLSISSHCRNKETQVFKPHHHFEQTTTTNKQASISTRTALLQKSKWENRMEVARHAEVEKVHRSPLFTCRISKNLIKIYIFKWAVQTFLTKSTNTCDKLD